MKAYGGVDIQIHVFLTSVLVVDEWSASRPDRFTPGERDAGTHWMGGWVGPRRHGENSCAYSNSDSSVVQPVASRYTDCATTQKVQEPLV
jgi:hypothetical protein